MAEYDIFNGDADGICALHQLRLSEPSDRNLITGVKRDIKLLNKVVFAQNDIVSVFDISIDSNIKALKNGLKNGALFEWFDHHSSLSAPDHPNFRTYLTSEQGVCSSLMVDKYLKGRYRSWALVACYGDNFQAKAQSLGTAMGLSANKLEAIRVLGEIINYNSYGESIEDLYIAPEDLYRQIQNYCNPFDFLASEKKIVTSLRNQMQEDFQRGLDASSERIKNLVITRLPNKKWARRISGLLANRLIEKDNKSAQLVLLKRDHDYTVSIRKPTNHIFPASEIARKFPSGGGRFEAAGINSLRCHDIQKLIDEIIYHYK